MLVKIQVLQVMMNKNRFCSEAGGVSLQKCLSGAAERPDDRMEEDRLHLQNKSPVVCKGQ